MAIDMAHSSLSQYLYLKKAVSPQMKPSYHYLLLASSLSDLSAKIQAVFDSKAKNFVIDKPFREAKIQFSYLLARQY